MVAEEFLISSVENVQASRRQELQASLLTHLHQIMSMLLNLLRITQCTGFLIHVLNTLYSSYIQGNSTIFKQNINQARNIAMSSIESLSKYFTWMPLTKQVENQKHIQIIPNCLKLLCGYVNVNDIEVASSALSCIGDFLSKVHIPIEFNGLIIEICKVMTNVLNGVLSSNKKPVLDLDTQFV